MAGITQLLCMAEIASTFVQICASSHDRIHVRLNENEIMGTKKTSGGRKRGGRGV